MALRHSLFEVDIGPVRRSEPRIDSSCCFSTAQESDSRSNVSLATQFFQQPARTKISARILRGRWSTGRYLFQLAPSGAGFFSLRIPEFESADPGILNSPVVMCANLRAPQKWVEILAAAAYSPRRSSNVKSLRCAVLAS